jgi:hypothetical protein
LFLPSLQPVATRLQSLCIEDIRLEGSADGFLGASWSALTSLLIASTWVSDDVLTAINLPALKSLDIEDFEFGSNLDTLQPHQMCCPQLSSLAFNTEWPKAQAGEGARQCCSLVHLPLLASVIVTFVNQKAPMDLGLPASLEHLTVRQRFGDGTVDLKWLLLEAMKCIRSGAQLQSLTCANASPSCHPEGVPWGASSVEHYSQLGGQLRGLKALSVFGRATTLLSATAAVACSAPDLTRLEFRVEDMRLDFTLPPICSASLQSITGRFNLEGHRVPAATVILTILPGCTELRDVHVQFYRSLYASCDRPEVVEGTSVKIRCHCTSQSCIKPLDASAGLGEVGMHFLPMPPSSQGVQAYTVNFTCHAAGPEEPLKWGHVVMPGVL